jgi:hypothetical protein
MKTHNILWIARAGRAARVCASLLALAATSACGDDKGDDDSSTTLTTTDPSTDPTGTGTDTVTPTTGTDTTDPGTDTTATTPGDTGNTDDTGVNTDDTGVNTDDTGVVDDTGNTDDTGVNTDDTGDDTGPVGPSFAIDVHGPIISNSCGCHVGGSGGLTLGATAVTAYAAIVGVPSSDVPGMNLVTAGDPENSYLLHKVRDTHEGVGGEGSQMPLGGAPLDQAQIDVITEWIAAGALP